jgi:hypothetical protein
VFRQIKRRHFIGEIRKQECDALSAKVREQQAVLRRIRDELSRAANDKMKERLRDAGYSYNKMLITINTIANDMNFMLAAIDDIKESAGKKKEQRANILDRAVRAVRR